MTKHAKEQIAYFYIIYKNIYVCLFYKLYETCCGAGCIYIGGGGGGGEVSEEKKVQITFIWHSVVDILISICFDFDFDFPVLGGGYCLCFWSPVRYWFHFTDRFYPFSFSSVQRPLHPVSPVLLNLCSLRQWYYCHHLHHGQGWF